MGDSQMLIHESLNSVSWLSGKWFTDSGKGIFPTINEFYYHEDIEFKCIGQPMFNFTSTSKHPEKNTPMHQERGFLRINPGTNEMAFIISHNFGMTSIEEGIYDPITKEINLESANISRISFAKPPYVKKLKRCIKLVDPNKLMITLCMETDNTPLTEHLKSVYKRI